MANNHNKSIPNYFLWQVALGSFKINQELPACEIFIVNIMVGGC